MFIKTTLIKDAELKTFSFAQIRLAYVTLILNEDWKMQQV